MFALHVCLTCRDNSNPALKNYYKNYCNILSAVVKKSKKLTYAIKIDKSLNKNKAIWDVVKLETKKIGNSDQAIYRRDLSQEPP
jgi:hypothetical protein